MQPLPGIAGWVQHELWTFVYNGLDVSDMVARLNFLIELNLDTHCPTKTVKITNLDGRISSQAVKQACRRKTGSTKNMGIAPNTKI